MEPRIWRQPLVGGVMLWPLLILIGGLDALALIEEVRVLSGLTPMAFGRATYDLVPLVLIPAAVIWLGVRVLKMEVRGRSWLTARLVAITKSGAARWVPAGVILHTARPVVNMKGCLRALDLLGAVLDEARRVPPSDGGWAEPLS